MEKECNDSSICGSIILRYLVKLLFLTMSNYWYYCISAYISVFKKDTYESMHLILNFHLAICIISFQQEYPITDIKLVK